MPRMITVGHPQKDLSAPLVGQSRKALRQAAQNLQRLEPLADTLARVAEAVAQALTTGHKLLLFGNGGSAAQAQHIAAEFVGRFQSERDPLPAVALTTDTSALTAIGNDYGFEEIFARQLRALAHPGDVALGISTSGRSPNVLRALEQAGQLQLVRVALTGPNVSPAGRAADLCLRAPGRSTARIQEAHLVLLHTLCELVEHRLARGRK
jgi:D-sedoheptulose 7-phosphate isomerase